MLSLGGKLYTKSMKANDLYARWLSLVAARQGLYQSMTEQGLWGNAPAVSAYYNLVNEVDEAWLAYVAASSGVTQEEAAIRINANMHSARD